MIDEFLNNVQGRITAMLSSWFGPWFDSWFGWMHDPLTFWIVCFIALFAACFVVGWFLPFKWVRAGLGGILLGAGLFVAGGWKMRNEMNERLRVEREKQKKTAAAKKVQAPPAGNSWFN